MSANPSIETPAALLPKVTFYIPQFFCDGIRYQVPRSLNFCVLAFTMSQSPGVLVFPSPGFPHATTSPTLAAVKTTTFGFFEAETVTR